jgi:hypothetical protein
VEAARCSAAAAGSGSPLPLRLPREHHCGARPTAQEALRRVRKRNYQYRNTRESHNRRPVAVASVFEGDDTAMTRGCYARSPRSASAREYIVTVDSAATQLARKNVPALIHTRDRSRPGGAFTKQEDT